MRIFAAITFILTSKFLFAQYDTTYSENGVIKSITEKFADATIERTYYKSGSLKEININVIGPQWVYHESYCENGQLIKAYNPIAHFPSFVREYYCDGTISMEYYRSRKGYRGQFVMYHKNGKISKTGKFEASSSPIGDQKVGLWESFNAEGKKVYEAFYENGKLIREQKFE